MFDPKMIQKMQQELTEKMARNQEELGSKRVSASSGGGVVTATCNGNRELVGIEIKPDAVDLDDLQMLEDLVLAAVTQAMDKARELEQGELSKLTGGLHIPGLF